LLLVVMASAMQRMYLYVDEYGLTQLRFYVTAFMVWLAVVLAWFILTVLRGRRDRFAFGALVAAFAAVLAINAVNPDAIVARINLDRMQAGERFDAYYLTCLSADAVPVIVEALPTMSEADRRTVEDSIEPPSRWYRNDADWRTWNLGRSGAMYAVEGYASPDRPQAGRGPRLEG
jgi:hypothetical protein